MPSDQVLALILSLMPPIGHFRPLCCSRFVSFCIWTSCFHTFGQYTVTACDMHVFGHHENYKATTSNEAIQRLIMCCALLQRAHLPQLHLGMRSQRDGGFGSIYPIKLQYRHTKWALMSGNRGQKKWVHKTCSSNRESKQNKGNK